ncbi:hypothetical protein P171DRAFT_189214 [Karstenula rhodostoma CBS 690.94]|uniref:Uncharacterized protein n=1 Tax=Karstenula rhodostoma CBS 690.94 TaxID=1392251 RepID=A0A9P4PSA3_9PLEO|nr:hypothetical protein P171DRAFT_189214 [Karstenula rhodostoma CBS 690.94]
MSRIEVLAALGTVQPACQPSAPSLVHVSYLVKLGHIFLTQLTQAIRTLGHSLSTWRCMHHCV